MGGGVANIIHQKKIHQKGVTFSKKFTKNKRKKHIESSMSLSVKNIYKVGQVPFGFGARNLIYLLEGELGLI
jgi:hypothetical protein